MKKMCEVLEVSRSGYYAWKGGKKSFRQDENERLLERIREIHTKSHRTYGSPRIHARLKRSGIQCGHNRIAGLMRRNGILAQRQLRYRRQSISAHGRSIAENLLNRQFLVKKPNTVWVADITCFWTGSGWLNLAVVMDLYSRKIVGWAMHARMTDQLVIDALEMALMSRRPHSPLLHHSDQGSQYASGTFRHQLASNNIQCSMSRKGNCHDNAVAESFFKTLKIEWTCEKRFTTREDAKSSLFEFIEVFYNRVRLHSTLGYLSPAEYERMNVS